MPSMKLKGEKLDQVIEFLKGLKWCVRPKDVCLGRAYACKKVSGNAARWMTIDRDQSKSLWCDDTTTYGGRQPWNSLCFIHWVQSLPIFLPTGPLIALKPLMANRYPTGIFYSSSFYLGMRTQDCMVNKRGARTPATGPCKYGGLLSVSQQCMINI